MSDVTYTAPCMYCGQIVQIGGAETEEEAIRQATMNCGCEASTIFREREEQKEFAKKNIEGLFGISVAPENKCDEIVGEILMRAAEAIIDGRLDKIDLKINANTKASVTRNSKDLIVIKRTDSEDQVTIA